MGWYLGPSCNARYPLGVWAGRAVCQDAPPPGAQAVCSGVGGFERMQGHSHWEPTYRPLQAHLQRGGQLAAGADNPGAPPCGGEAHLMWVLH